MHDDDSFSIAIHEAAHAALLHHHGMEDRIRHIEMRPRPGRLARVSIDEFVLNSRTTRLDALRRCTIYLAGAVAEDRLLPPSQRLSPESLVDNMFNTATQQNSDIFQAKRCAQHVVGKEWRRFLVNAAWVTKGILRRRDTWRTVHALARRLSRVDRMDGPNVRLILRLAPLK